MSGRALQQILLASATALLRQVAADSDGDPSAARDVLDAAASQVGGFDLDGYRRLLGIDARLDTGLAHTWATKLLDLVQSSGVPTRLALATLAQPEVTDTRRRVTGAYYTDFRLAQYLARRTAQVAARPLTPSSTVIDTAAGTGVLLVALAEQIGRDDPGALRELVTHGLSAVDLDQECRRATVTTLAALTDDLTAIAGLLTRVKTVDSLLADGELWRGISHDGCFDAVIGNPPWERLRATRHEALLAGGSRRHYGADYEPQRRSDRAAHSSEVDRLHHYLTDLAARYPLLDDRDVDLWHAFLALGWSLVGPGGSLGMLLPAGLIRAQGTRRLREHLLTNATEVDLTVFHNRSRFFGIDTRFKFVAVCAQVPGRAGPGATLRLRHSSGNGSSGNDTAEPASVRIRFDDLAAARRDLTVPEVTGEREWQLFRHLTARGSAPHEPDSPWAMRITREVDMTRSRPLFSRIRSDAMVPVAEGRMVHHYRSRAKSYVSGTGRTAIWQPVALGEAARARAQFFVAPARLPDSVQERIPRFRIGFCDIVGQTNERTLQAALIAPGRVCGNKVPTIDFVGADEGERWQRELLFLAAANSFVVDWFIRRVVTTSLNYFILRSVPLPVVDPAGPAGRRLVYLAERLLAAETSGNLGAREVAEHRAEADVLICEAYGIDLADLPVLLADFPLLDRGQPALPGETRSTVTTDLLAGVCGDALARERYQAAASLGALAYVPEEFARVEAR
ncbi:MAG: Eco57I restriction-modification methylase domain-containing protein [Pseudonocardiaceae bacterium]